MIFAIVIPILFIVISIVDFTEKQNWVEERNSSSFESSFDYFHGEHKIPIELTKSEVLTFQVEIYNENGGGWGYHLENEKGDHLPMKESGERLEYETVENASYYIVLHGDEVEGRFAVDWEISD